MSAETIDQTRPPRLGDRVQLRTFTGLRGRIIEFRGPIGHKGRELFGIELIYPDHTEYTEAARDDLVYLDDGNDPEHPNPPAPATE
ncbi:hypothetical protein GobsT_36000 [Gemmata obscuriglobus]|uniref:DUF4926 domain-containing protein n=2 Tax=Gemmata TaxID=113 RepID=A0A2Z3GXZ3_9BACT|nr:MULTISPECIES: hypothetical protein [Gemmata]AWM38278.1 hypothetical protein C1280_15645 [Gemmata obscuriglobus]MDY3559277.1 hypothetical protein [Gemmata algarum]QEG28812.1 hypothetical protein GobsT_36000 [Gemmata obscuriglobus]VTS07194.1 unnamed protein product [Gemmata obscuriglobus UQM 2246]